MFTNSSLYTHKYCDAVFKLLYGFTHEIIIIIFIFSQT